MSHGCEKPLHAFISGLLLNKWKCFLLFSPLNSWQSPVLLGNKALFYCLCCHMQPYVEPLFGRKPNSDAFDVRVFLLSFRVMICSCCCRRSPHRGLQLKVQVSVCVWLPVHVYMCAWRESHCERISWFEYTHVLCLFYQHRCVFSLYPPAIPLPLPPPEACGLQRAAAAVFTACVRSGTAAWCFKGFTGGVTSDHWVDWGSAWKQKYLFWKLQCFLWHQTLSHDCWWKRGFLMSLSVRAVSVSWMRSCFLTLCLWAVTCTSISSVEVFCHSRDTRTGKRGNGFTKEEKMMHLYLSASWHSLLLSSW